MASSTQLLLLDPVPGAAEWAESRLRELEALECRGLEAADAEIALPEQLVQLRAAGARIEIQFDAALTAIACQK